MTRSGSPPPPITNFQWTITGDAISNWIPSIPSGIKYPNFAKNTNLCEFYWYHSGNYEAQCTAKFLGKVKTVRASFTVQAPEVELIPTVVGEIRADSVYSKGAGNWLHFGGYLDSTGTNPIPGIKFRLNILSTNCIISRSLFVFVQVGSAQRTLIRTNGVTYTSNVGAALDNAFGYWNYPFDPDLEPQTTGDSPGQPTLASYSSASANDSFTMYLMFRHDSLASDVYVPLKSVDWSWAASAVITNATSNQWQLISPQYPSPTVNENPDYPQWTTWLIPLRWLPTAPPP